METCNYNAIILNILSQVVVPLTSTILGAIISGIATYCGARWQYEKKEEKENRRVKRELVDSVVKASTDLQIATSSNFMISDIKGAEKSISEVVSAYAVFLKTIENTRIYFPQDIRKTIEEYRDLTYHNITIWRGKIWNDLIYKNDPLVPFIDQTTKDGRTKKAYNKMEASLSKYVNQWQEC